MQLSQVTVTFIVLYSYLVDSLAIGSRRNVRSISSMESCLTFMKKRYEKQLHIHANDATYHFNNKNSNNVTEKEWAVDEDSPQDCPVEPLNGVDHDLSERSICPWYTVVNHDAFRYPQDLIDVKCRCAECIKFAGVCESVSHYVPVLRFESNNAHKKGKAPKCDSLVKWSSQRISVGCTCAMRRTH